jgi:hypothetical protein
MLISITRVPFAPLTTGSSNIIYPPDQIIVCPSLCNASHEIRMGAAQQPPLSRMRPQIRQMLPMLPSVLGFADSAIIFYGYRTLGRPSNVNLMTSILLSSLITVRFHRGVRLTRSRERQPGTCPRGEAKR